VQDWDVALPVPGRITELAIEVVTPDDHRVKFTVESGAVVTVLGRDVHDPPAPFSDTFDLWAFLVMQSAPADLIARELSRIDPHWEDVVKERRPCHDLDAAKAIDEEHRRRLRSEFKRGQT
jgi:hypothetical protein